MPNTMLLVLDMINDLIHEDGPNGTSHLRSTLVGPQLLVPLREDGTLALGTYQGIFFCEFDGPRERRVHVTVLQ